jgi:hypothetical protein
MLAEVHRAVAAGQDQATIVFADTELHLEKAPDGGLILRAPGGPAWMRVYLTPLTVPPGYPLGLPFVANVSVTVGEERGVYTLVWWASDDPESLFRNLSEQCIEGGWVVRERAPDDMTSATQQVFVQGELERYVMLSGGIVTLHERASRRRRR